MVGMDVRFDGSVFSSMVPAKGDLTASMSDWMGVPVSSRIFSSWFMVLVPGKIGRPLSISPRIHPTAHRSTPLVYLAEPSRISGARYLRRGGRVSNGVVAKQEHLLGAHAPPRCHVVGQDGRRTLQ